MGTYWRDDCQCGSMDYFSSLPSLLSLGLGFYVNPFKNQIYHVNLYVSILILIILITICFAFNAFCS